jgi:hypothetical protein
MGINHGRWHGYREHEGDGQGGAPRESRDDPAEGCRRAGTQGGWVAAQGRAQLGRDPACTVEIVRHAPEQEAVAPALGAVRVDVHGA